MQRRMPLSAGEVLKDLVEQPEKLPGFYSGVAGILNNTEKNLRTRQSRAKTTSLSVKHKSTDALERQT